jgi:hypothetical protein
MYVNTLKMKQKFVWFRRVAVVMNNRSKVVSYAARETRTDRSCELRSGNTGFEA